MNIYNILITWDKAGRADVFSYPTRGKAFIGAFQLLTKMNIENKEEVLQTLRKKEKAFSRKDKKRFCMQLVRRHLLMD